MLRPRPQFQKGDPGTVTVKVVSSDGFGEIFITVAEGATYGAVAEKYAAERYVPVDAVQLSKRGRAIAVDLAKVAEKNDKLEGSVLGLHGLRKLFELYDGGAGLPGPNQRVEVGPAIKKIVFGNLVMEPWHSSPYPRHLAEGLKASGGVMWLCDVCLRYTADKQCMAHHIKAHGGCAQGAHPPGERVFLSRDEAISVWRVDGGIGYDSVINARGLPSAQAYDMEALRQHTQHELYCLHIGLLARFYLKGKTAFYCPGSFYYYVLCEEIGGASRFRGFYSVEKGPSMNSLACIMVLPPWQDRGFGRLLIHVSYLNCLPKPVKRKDGDVVMLCDKSPERPLSDLGMTAFLSYWKGAVVHELIIMASDDAWSLPAARKGGRDIEYVCSQTRIRKTDVFKAMHVLDLLVNPGAANPELDWVAVKQLTKVRRVELDLMRGGHFAPTHVPEPEA